MTWAVLLAAGVLAVPVVLLFSATACAELLEIESGEVPPYGKVILGENGLIGYWRLDEPEDALEAKDSFLTGEHNGTYRDPDGFELQKVGALKNDIKNGAAKFDGGFVEVPFDPPLTPPALTVELWLKVTDPNTNSDEWRDVIGCYVPNADNPDRINRGYRIRVMTVDIQGTRALRVQADLGDLGNGLSRTVNLDEWHYVVLTYAKAEGAQLYIDQQPSLPAAKPLDVVVGKSDGEPLRFGGNRGDSPPTFEGLLDEIALYGRALDAKTIESHYAFAHA